MEGSHFPSLNDLHKHFRERLNVWLGGGISLLLIDEYVKEGYFFKPSDVVYPGTHENLITLLFILLLINWKVKKNDGKRESD